MGIDKALKKNVIEDWQNAFPQLTMYAQNKLYKRCGAFIFGIETLSLPRSEDYRPIFVCYPLWKPDVKQCLDEPVFMQEVYDNKGLQFNIPYVNNFVFLKEAVDCTKKQAPLLLEKNVFLNQIFESIDKQFSQGLIRASPIGQVKLLEAKLHAALYVDDANKCNNVFKELRHMVNNYDPTFLEWKLGNLEIWLSSLEKVITNRAIFLKQIEVNKQDKKIAQLKNSELTA